jgi:hypothetical protein
LLPSEKQLEFLEVAISLYNSTNLHREFELFAYKKRGYLKVLPVLIAKK